MGHSVANSDYSSNIRRLQICGWWRVKTDSRTFQILYRFYRCFSYTWMLTICTCQIVDLPDASQDLEKFSTNICCSSVSILTLMMNFIILQRMDNIERLQMNLDHNLYQPHVGQFEEDKRILDRGRSEFLRLKNVFFTMANLSLLGWALMGVFVEGRTPLRMWLPFDWHSDPLYRLIYFAQITSVFLFITNIVTHDTMFVGFIIQLCCHYDILECNIKRWGKAIDHHPYKSLRLCHIERRLANEIKKNIRHHQAILKSIKEVQMIYEENFLFHFSGSVPLISFIGYIVFTGKVSGVNFVTVCNVCYVLCVIFDIYIYCFYGTQLLNKGERIAETVYEVAWLNLGRSSCKLLLTVMMRAQESAGLSIRKFFQLNLYSFLGMLKLCYNILAVIIQVSYY